MMNYIWMFMLVISFFLAALNGRMEQVTQAVIDSSQGAVQMSLGLLGVMCLWSGLMKVAEKGGMVAAIARFVRPLMGFLFPEVPVKHPAAGSIVMNLVANFFGLGNAATPLGLKAMSEMQKLNPAPETATDSMCMFLILNTCSIQLIPATVIAIRSAASSANPSEIIGTVWVATIVSAAVGILLGKLCSIRVRRK